MVLFDEIEKAHHDVFNVMLQVLDDGRLTDGQGRTVDFKNTIVIMTSNIGSQRILEYRGGFDGEGYERMKEAVLDEMRQHFRPEFLNRVDEIIVFHALSEEHLKQIVEIQLGRLRARLAERHITLELTDAARDNLVRTGYDPAYGARPLKRAIQKEIENAARPAAAEGRRSATARPWWSIPTATPATSSSNPRGGTRAELAFVTAIACFYSGPAIVEPRCASTDSGTARARLSSMICGDARLRRDRDRRSETPRPVLEPIGTPAPLLQRPRFAAIRLRRLIVEASLRSNSSDSTGTVTS